MKIKSINIVMCMFATALIMISCSKEKTATEPTSYNQSIEKARQHQQFLKAAKLKKDGKWLKTEKHYSYAEAFDELGGALNYAYTFPTNTNGNVYTYDVQISIPVSSQNDITETSLLDGFNDAVDALRDEYRKLTHSGKTLVAVSGVNQGVDPSTGNLVISLSAVIGYGNPVTSGAFSQADSWRYEVDGGTCSGQGGIEGAPQILENYMNDYCYRPGAGVHIWFWPQVVYLPVRDSFPSGDPIDNYCDYLIFYANGPVAAITDLVMCLEYNQNNSCIHEMDFYLDGATQIMQEWLASSSLNPNNYHYIRCKFGSYSTYNSLDDILTIGHDEKFFFGELHSIGIDEEEPGYPTSIL